MNSTIPEEGDVERRDVTRYPGQMPVAVETLGLYGNCPWLGQTRDVSVRGIGFTLPRRFESGTAVSLKFLKMTDNPLTILARVVRVAQVGGGDWLLGCRFSQEVDPDDFHPLLEQLEMSMPTNAQDNAIPSAARANLQKIRERLQRLQQSKHDQET